MTENWQTWYIEGADFECRFRFLKFRPQDPFLGKFGPKKSNLSVLPENWHTWYLEDVNSYFNISFQNSQPKIHFWANLGQKTQSCPFCLKIGTHGISRMLILISTLIFWISNQTSIFGQMWAKKLKVVCGTNGISTMWILISTLVFWILKSKSIFGQS